MKTTLLDTSALSRRKMLRWGGTAVAAAAIMTTGIGGITLDQAFAQRMAGAPGPVDLGTGDVGVLNYAYALEQLEAAFYATVLANPYSGMSQSEQAVLGDIAGHEAAHRDFLSGALGAAKIPDLEPNFTKINFGNRRSVLSTAKVFEDLGVAAYNGAGQLLTDPKNLLQAGRIVSIEARHAEIIGILLQGNNGGVVDANGLDKALLPSRVLPAAAPFVKTPISARGLH